MLKERLRLTQIEAEIVQSLCYHGLKRLEELNMKIPKEVRKIYKKIEDWTLRQELDEVVNNHE